LFQLGEPPRCGASTSAITPAVVTPMMVLGMDALGLGAHLWAIVVPLVIGLLVGFLLLEALQRARLRFTWVLLGAPLAYLLWFADWQLGLVLAVATGTALWLGAHGHAEALQHGGEEAAAVLDSHGPLRWALSRFGGRRARQRRLRGERLAIGAARRSGVCRVPFGLSHGVHALVIGATGSGKTVTQAAIVEAYVLANFGAIVIDPKGDRDLHSVARRSAQRAGSRFLEWTPSGPTVYNPLARGGPTEIADKAFFAAHRWSEAHYELATQRLLGQALATMKAAGIWPPTLSTLVAHMDPERLDAVATKAGGKSAERVSSYVDGLSGHAKADLGGGRDRLAVLAEGELGRWLDPEQDGGEVLDLGGSLRRGEVLYFHLDADRYPAAAKLLASALLIDLVGLSAERQGGSCGGLLVIDEFAALAAEQVSRLFARARSAGLSLLLGTQSLADLRGVRPDDPSDTLTERVLSNVEFTVAHRIGDPDSAERLARLAGTRPAWSTTQRISGDAKLIGRGEGTRTREREFVVLPDQFKRLRTGEAVVIDPKAKRPGEIVKIWAPHSGLGGSQ
jgi:hypothetical protein